ncbi:hypothetical protein DL96DRAFT_1690820 [Flagelloscypha sp. PMI_526]|nr:hypothetical protein DL96DRAFT_1690820 [Flagelloscypha sp. PMI_526]
MDPLLPPEIEQQIFHFSAVSEPTMISSLLLVSSRVKDWGKIPAREFPSYPSNVNITHIAWDFDAVAILEELILHSQLPHLSHIQLVWWKDGSNHDLADINLEENIILKMFPELDYPSIVLLPFGGILDFREWNRAAFGGADCWMHAKNIIHNRQMGNH